MVHFEIHDWHRSSRKLLIGSIPIVGFKVSLYDGKSQLIEYCHLLLWVYIVMKRVDMFLWLLERMAGFK